MRWPAKSRGEKRSKLKFAWRPVRKGAVMVWLEFYRIEQELRVIDGKYKWVELN